jgi:hypothetical protein
VGQSRRLGAWRRPGEGVWPGTAGCLGRRWPRARTPRGRGYAPADNVKVYTCLKLKNSNFLNTSAQNSEYESCRSHYHLQLSQRPYGFFLNRFCTKGFANFECHSISMNRGYCHLGKFFTFFHSKFKTPIYMKVVSLNKLDNFHEGRFLSV